MKTASGHKAGLPLVALVAATVVLCALTSTALATSPLPRADYTVRAACAAPTPGRASCMALQLVPRTAEARAHIHPLAASSTHPRPGSAASEGVFGLTPGDLHTAYMLPDASIGQQTVALVDAYNDPTAESDLKAYDRALGLPACTSANGCFEKVNQRGETGNLPFPKSTAELEAGRSEEAEEAEGWGTEISLDMETAHGTCQSCKILLVEAKSPTYENLEAAEQTAETLGATEISNSWGGPEFGETPELESSSAFNDPGIVITASAGDDGYLEWLAESPSHEASFPASSPHVVAVGGTRLITAALTGAWQNEKVWNDGGVSGGEKVGYGAGGGGCSKVFSAPLWQSGVTGWSEVGCSTKRAVSDVAADADPYTGVAVYDTSRECESEYKGSAVHWCTFGGTSLASPIIAATYALAGGANGVSYPARTLYENLTEHPSSLHDVISGSNGECAKPFDAETGATGCSIAEEGANCSLKAICLARTGFDGPSGVGTPHGLAAFQLPATEPEATEEEILNKEKTERQEEATRRGAAKGEEEAERKEEREQAEREERERKEAEGKESEKPRPVLTGSSSPAPSPAPPAPPAASSASLTPQLSALALTLKAVVALNASHPRISQVAFAFNLNLPMQVRITLTKRVRVHRHTRWQTIRNSLTFTAKSGANSQRLKGNGKLGPGTYRLTATPIHGTARSILFQIG